MMTESITIKLAGRQQSFDSPSDVLAELSRMAKAEREARENLIVTRVRLGSALRTAAPAMGWSMRQLFKSIGVERWTGYAAIKLSEALAGDDGEVDRIRLDEISLAITARGGRVSLRSIEHAAGIRGGDDAPEWHDDPTADPVTGVCHGKQFDRRSDGVDGGARGALQPVDDWAIDEEVQGVGLASEAEASTLTASEAGAGPTPCGASGDQLGLFDDVARSIEHAIEQARRIGGERYERVAVALERCRAELDDVLSHSSLATSTDESASRFD